MLQLVALEEGFSVHQAHQVHRLEVPPPPGRPTASRHGVDNFRLFFTVDIDVSACVGSCSIKVKAGLPCQIDGSSSNQ